jgi:hypothetical protein
MMVTTTTTTANTLRQIAVQGTTIAVANAHSNFVLEYSITSSLVVQSVSGEGKIRLVQQHY